jgi:hypothetical protein
VKQAIRPIRLHCQPEARIGSARYTRAASNCGDIGIHRRDIRHYQRVGLAAHLFDRSSNKQIAAAVFLAEGTVKNYVSRIMEKLHANTRTELAVMSVRQRRGD